MPVTITFYKISEKKPKHGQQVIYLRGISSFDMYGYEPRETTAYYTWEEIDEEGEETGNSACYDPEEFPDIKVGETIDEGYKLMIQFDEYIATDDVLWVDYDEYWANFEDD